MLLYSLYIACGDLRDEGELFDPDHSHLFEFNASQNDPCLVSVEEDVVNVEVQPTVRQLVSAHRRSSKRRDSTDQFVIECHVLQN